jgi:hypothetical protein
MSYGLIMLLAIIIFIAHAERTARLQRAEAMRRHPAGGRGSR